MGKKKSTEKRFFWFKFKDNFFQNPTIKYLNTLPGGSDLIIGYQKLMLLSLETEGIVRLQGLFQTREEELALLIDIELNTTRLLITTLLKTHDIELINDNTIYILSIQGLIGSEGSSAERVRKFRERQKDKEEKKMLQSNIQETLFLGTKEENLKDDNLLQCNAPVTNR